MCSGLVWSLRIALVLEASWQVSAYHASLPSVIRHLSYLQMSGGDSSNDVDWLEVKLKVALETEDYAAAAQLRDRLREISDCKRLEDLTSNWAERAAPKPRAPLASDSDLIRRIESPLLPDVEFAQASAVKRVPGFLSDADIEAIHATAAQVRAEKGTAGQRENCFERQVREGGRTVFINERLWQLLPDLYARIVATAREADSELWGGLLDGRHALSLRSAEYHTVLEEGGLAMPNHLDHGSLVTVDLMLSDTSDFDGGALQTLEADGSLLTHEFERGDALFFLSHKYHAVSALKVRAPCVLWTTPSHVLCACMALRYGMCTCMPPSQLPRLLGFLGPAGMMTHTTCALLVASFSTCFQHLPSVSRFTVPRRLSSPQAGRRNIMVLELWEGVRRRCPQR